MGALTRQELPRRALAERLCALSQERYRLPGASATRTFAVPTLARWYRLYKKGGLAALRPEPRSDSGAVRALTPAQQELVCDVRRENPHASAELIIDTLTLEGRIERGAIYSAYRASHDALPPRTSGSPFLALRSASPPWLKATSFEAYFHSISPTLRTSMPPWRGSYPSRYSVLLFICLAIFVDVFFTYCPLRSLRA